MKEIIENLYLSDILLSGNGHSILKDLNIERIVAAFKGDLPGYSYKSNIEVYQVAVDDDDEEDILEHIPNVINWIDEGLQQSIPTLVLCQAGVSRSAAIVTAYLMRKKTLSVEDALSYLQSVSPSADPNQNFRHQLKIFELAGYSTSTENPLVRRYKLLRKARTISGYQQDDDGSSLLQLYQQRRSISKSTAIRCKQCRSLAQLNRMKLAGYEDIVMYIPSSPFYVEALEWMDLIGGEVSGKLYCPNSKCKSKVGTYDWTGVKDGHLNQYVTPAIMLHQNKSEVYQIGVAANNPLSLLRGIN
ncbi:phosphatases II [Wallemia mellicola]|uniref:protein-tyrosine-phosphatase n=1 Tax=Wallemia mellicola TaxID=1708541 RepID=A0A4T0M3S2_9BASI|nr:hypothetical protein E3Q23_01650 [Wallemia mellicola]TIC00294.1 phosphatases II [Wallemia mellicola]TIC05512.1 phosphatases II [Wallemia mellicola]TIC13624.1 phosphatases II [Wallemia mellicola]TIC17719.1 phosphatases II [Wallemia mellicola]